MKQLLNYFLRGLLFVFPIVGTAYIIYASVNWANDTFNELLFDWLSVNIPGLGILAVFLGLSGVGWLVSKLVRWPAFNYIDRLFNRLPLVKIIYSSLKELSEAFVGENRKFNVPVMAEINENGVMRFGFITEETFDTNQLSGHVAVYCPHSYNFSGNLYLIPNERVHRLEADPTELMKFVVSAGVTDLELENEG